ncbi:LAME_0H07778g1_1 [Lachancea meyersii CBS 8951]|uniref:LAME_0H07778g1_1 n=1 Tax=Lachancea meyersii CBS 8951 TaxID=1266667 RepID=A0A1G4KFJ4_9SACH|nr:LAME_0H07778g1_1 [Lachancea meyersii CBS 8951]
MNTSSSRPRSHANSPQTGAGAGAGARKQQTPSPRSSTSSQISEPGKLLSNGKSSLLPQLFTCPQLDINVAMNYVLQRFFEMQDAQLAPSLRALDLVVEQTYAESLTLRQLNDSFSNKQYRYFNTVSRNKQISNCPVFCVAVYAASRWGGHPQGLPIRFEDFHNMPLLADTSSFEALAASRAAGVSPSPEQEPEPANGALAGAQGRILRVMEPPEELRSEIFPWLDQLQQDLETKDRTNYNLHSLCELFEYLARVLVQDLAYLSCTNELPHLLSNVLGYVPRLEGNFTFKQFRNEMHRMINSSQSKTSDWNDQVLSKVEEGYIDISRRFALHNQFLQEELKSLRHELGSVKQLLSEVLNTQRLLVSGNAQNGAAFPASLSVTGRGSGSADKNGLSSSFFNNVVGTGEEQAQTTPSLAPINMFHSLSGSGVVETQKRKLPLPNQAGFSPTPIESPFKRFRFDDLKAGPPTHQQLLQQQQLQQQLQQQAQPNTMNATLDSMMSRNAVSPRLGISALTSAPMSSQLSPRYGNSNLSSQLLTKRTPSSTSPNGNSSQEVFKYKLSRENKTIWDLYNEWYVGLNGEPSIKSLIDTYGWRRWKVGEDSHFFPTRRIIIDYIEREVDRGLRTGRFLNTDRESMRKVITDDLEKFRTTNGLTLNSISMYFRNLTRKNTEICIYENFQDWSVLQIDEDEKNKYCKRQHNTGS